MRILLIDIETAPNLAYCWGLFKENIGHDQVVNSGYVLCFAAKWYGEREVKFFSVRDKGKAMLRNAHKLLDEADAVVHYYGSHFDIPTLNKEFILAGMAPPSPVKQVDLCNVVRSQFKFTSNKLDYVCKALGLGQKTRHKGFELWVKCMEGDAGAWRLMERYNKQDVLLTERLYDRLKPWVRAHPNHSNYVDKAVCPNCGSKRFQRRGIARTTQYAYVRYQCQACGAWFRGTRSLPAKRKERFTRVAE